MLFRKGSRPTIKCLHTKKRFSIFGALSQGEFFTQLIEEKCNAETWLQFLNSLLLKYPKILIVLDGAKYHFEKEHVQKFYEENKHRLVVIQLPAYSPNLNPVEQSWKKIKYFLAITPWATEKEFKAKLLEGISRSDSMAKMFEYYLP